MSAAPPHDVEEALHLADRTLILSARPAKIQSIVQIPFAQPRTLTNLGIVELKKRILWELGMGDGDSI